MRASAVAMDSIIDYLRKGAPVPTPAPVASSSSSSSSSSVAVHVKTSVAVRRRVGGGLATSHNNDNDEDDLEGGMRLASEGTKAPVFLRERKGVLVGGKITSALTVPDADPASPRSAMLSRALDAAAFLSSRLANANADLMLLAALDTKRVAYIKEMNESGIIVSATAKL